MRTFGYARVSTTEQILDRQLDMLSKYGVDRIYSEKMTGRAGTDLSCKKCLMILIKVVVE